MTASRARLRAFRCARRRSEDGFVLPLVLGIFLLTYLVILALLGLTITSSRVTAAQADSARQQRAAASALESYLGELARNAAFTPCDSVAESNRLTVDEDGSGGEDALELHVHCDDDVPSAAGGGGADLPLPVGPRVEIVGQEYQGSVGTSGPTTLRHQGGGPLLFSSDVEVRRGAAVDGGAVGPALRLSGEYAQGDGGCEAFTGAASIEDASGGPTCDDAQARALEIRTGSLFGPDEQPGDVEVPETCVGPLMTLDPGRYDAVDTARLNAMWGPGGCSTTTTFHFTPGRYLFDVNDPLAADERQNALVIDNDQVRIVFGAARGDAATARFPQACHTGRSGASIQLTGRTTIRHRAGRVAICPAFSGTGAPYPAIVQSDLAPSQPVLDTAEPELGTTFRVEGCNPDCSIETTWASTGNVPLQNAEIQFRSWESPPSHQAERQVLVSVTTTDGSSCNTGWRRSGRSDNLYTTIDLMAFGSCATTLQGESESTFEGASIEISHRYTANAVCNPLTEECIRLRIDDVRLRTNVRLAAGSSASTPGGWGGASNALALDGAKADATHGSECWVWPVFDLRGLYSCRLDRPTTRSFEIGGANPVGGGIRESDHVETLTVRVNSDTDDPPESWAADPGDTDEDDAMRVELRLVDGRTCSAVHDGYSRSNMGLELDLTSPSGDCDGIVETMGDLRGASVRLSFRTGCARFFDQEIWDWDGQRCFMARLPDFDRITLAVTTDTVRSSPGALVTVADDADTSFNVYGDTLMPRADLDVVWGGAHTADPVVGGFLSLNGLGSRAEGGADAGVVCCAAPTTAILQARLVDPSTSEENWVVLTQATVAFGAALDAGGSFRRTVSVVAWTACGRGGCVDTSVLGNTTVADPSPGGG